MIRLGEGRAGRAVTRFTGTTSFILCLALGFAGAARADESDAACDAPQTQVDMTLCAVQDWRAADAELNAAYADARTALREVDAGLPVTDRGAEAALVDAQRAWITMRDKGCAAEGYLVRGGSMEPMLVAGCMARVTRARTTDLTILATPMEGP